MVVDKAHTVERFNRTLKENIHKRLNAMGLDTDKRTSQLNAVVNKYNNTVHSTIKMTPSTPEKMITNQWFQLTFGLMQNAIWFTRS